MECKGVLPTEIALPSGGLVEEAIGSTRENSNPMEGEEMEDGEG